MSFTIRRSRAVIRKFDPTPEYWYDTKLITNEKGEAVVVTYWRNPELAGIWELRYKVIRKCLCELFQQQLIEHDGSKDPNSYTLSDKGCERLSKN
jgi:hypothetical protein